MLGEKVYDAALAIKLLDSYNHFLKKFKSDNHFNAILVDASDMSSEIYIDKTLELIPKDNLFMKIRINP